MRAVSCISVGYFAEFLQPQILSYYEQVIPFIIQTLASDTSIEVKEKCCYTLDAFAEHMEGALLPYVRPLMQQFLELLTKGDRKIQSLAIPAIATIASASGQVIFFLID